MKWSAMRDERVCWVEFELDTSAQPAVQRAYDTVRNSRGGVDNLYKAMALSPDAIEPADQLYRQLLHNDDCPFEPWLRELIATQVASICASDYALANHGENFHDAFGDRQRSQALLDTVRRGAWEAELDDPRLRAILSFNDKLARTPQEICQTDIQRLRDVGLDDKEIVYLSQISASFAYWSRIINALGITIGDEPVGLAGKASG